MTQQVIARGKVKHHVLRQTTDYWIHAEDGDYYLGKWARPYVGQTLVISLEEPGGALEGKLEREMSPIFA